MPPYSCTVGVVRVLTLVGYVVGPFCDCKPISRQPRESTEPFPIRLMAIDIKREVEAGVDRQK